MNSHFSGRSGISVSSQSYILKQVTLVTALLVYFIKLPSFSFDCWLTCSSAWVLRECSSSSNALALGLEHKPAVDRDSWLRLLGISFPSLLFLSSYFLSACCCCVPCIMLGAGTSEMKKTRCVLMDFMVCWRRDTSVTQI